MKNKSAFTFLSINKGTVSSNLQPQLISTQLFDANREKEIREMNRRVFLEALRKKIYTCVMKVPDSSTELISASPIQSNSALVLDNLESYCEPVHLFPPLILVYKITIPETRVRLPLSNIEGTLIIDWGDMSDDDTIHDTVDDDTINNDTNIIHTYKELGLYTVIVSAGSNSTSIGRFGSNLSVIGINCLVAVKNWGDFNFKSFKKAFASAKNLVKVPNNIPNSVTNLSGMFYNTDLFNQDISSWDVSNVTDMSYMFYCARSFNQPLIKWNIKNVITIDGMFIGAKQFNQDISHWPIKCVFTNIK